MSYVLVVNDSVRLIYVRDNNPFETDQIDHYEKPSCHEASSFTGSPRQKI